jgi:hypothetical protein
VYVKSILLHHVLRREGHRHTYERIADRVLGELEASDEAWQHAHLTKLGVCVCVCM